MSRRRGFSEVSPLFTWRSAVRDDRGLSGNAKHLALTLATYMSEGGDSAFPSLDTLAKDCGRSKSTVLDSRGELRDQGWLLWTSGGGRGRRTYYEALIPEETVRRAYPFLGDGAPPQSTAGASDGASAATGATAAIASSNGRETVRVANGFRGGKPSLSAGETVQSGRVNSPTAVRDHVRTTSGPTAAADAAVAAAVDEELHRLGAGRALRELAAADVDRARAWVELAKTDATVNPLGFVRAGLESGESPSRRGAAAPDPAEAAREWIERTAWKLDPDEAHLLLETRGISRSHDLHRLLDETRARHLAERAADAGVPVPAGREIEAA